MQREELIHLKIGLRHLLLFGRPSSRPPRLLILRELRLHQLCLLRLLQAFHLYSEGGELGDRLPPLLRIPVADILLLELPGELSEVRAAGDLVAAFHVLHGEERVVLTAHLVEAEVY